MDKLREIFEEMFLEDKPVKLVFSAKRRKSIEYGKVTMRPVEVSGRIEYQAEYVFENKVTHTNVKAAYAPDFCLALMKDDFKQANIFTVSRDIQILASKPENPRVTEKAATLSCQNFAHNRTKNYIIPDVKPCDFLIRLGVMDESGKVFQKHYSKFRQINRFLEIVDDVFPHLTKERGNDLSGTSAEVSANTSDTDSSMQANGSSHAQTRDHSRVQANASSCASGSAQKPLRIIDFGCGKAYLTFAIYHYLKLMKGLDVEIIGLDLKQDVISFCNKVASDLGYDTLKFLRGDIADYTNDHADMVVTLHACDTATDYALINAVSWNTKVILSVPCCQHELFSQIKNDIQQPMLKHGILKDRLTEYLTDSLRGLKLESKGYDVAMIEFTSLEHTARNIMIKAVKKFDCNGQRAVKAQRQYEALRDFYHVMPAIDRL